MTEIQVISSTRIEARNQNSEFNGRIDLTPWDLQFLPFEAIQQGIAIKSPLTPDIYIPIIKSNF
ncbi:putative acetyltransferase [Senna tora]|uniref:Putative acetyltransferase n=1 Tax=Senna tora TaxID=362788 RepID=A0A834XBT4_9FABA|nr:putative acetyltransferase [Senna tora]